jgi:hypothetical protein
MGDRTLISIHVGPIYELNTTRYSIEYLLVSFKSATFWAPRSSHLGQQNARRPARKLRKVAGILEERCILYPSLDVLGRRDCVDQAPVLSDMELEYVKERSGLMLADDASGDLLGL